jgi:hypothetical protein
LEDLGVAFEGSSTFEHDDDLRDEAIAIGGGARVDFPLVVVLPDGSHLVEPANPSLRARLAELGLVGPSGWRAWARSDDPARNACSAPISASWVVMMAEARLAIRRVPRRSTTSCAMSIAPCVVQDHVLREEPVELGPAAGGGWSGAGQGSACRPCRGRRGEDMASSASVTGTPHCVGPGAHLIDLRLLSCLDLRPARSLMTGLAARVGARSAMTTACSWWGIIVWANITSALPDEVPVMADGMPLIWCASVRAPSSR